MISNETELATKLELLQALKMVHTMNLADREKLNRQMTKTRKEIESYVDAVANPKEAPLR